ncbi:MAG: M14 family metallopeptidase [Bacteroidia bacterium]|nr:M14 family metallopeptidase [Bacteroidia bacterium]
MHKPFHILCLGVAITVAHLVPAVAQEGWLTHFEKSGFRSSPDYAETMRWLNRLDSASEWISVQSFGLSPQGRALPLVIVSKDGTFNPQAARAGGKNIILIQAGIHSGEIDGKDAGMMLLREIAVTRTLAKLADHAVILFMPIFNVDGHERRSPFNRINQDGPDTMGWRVTATNLNLNRDYMKADAPEMKAWLRTFNEWMPDMLIDCHVTDGIDFQYNLSYAAETYGNMHPIVADWQNRLQYWFIDAMEKAGDPVIPYVFPRENNDLSKGLVDWASQPRLSTGYAAVRNRANLLIETHSLKPFKDRVYATYRLLQAVLEFNAAYPGTLRDVVRRAEEDDRQRFRSGDTTSFPLRFQATDKADTIQFKGFATELRNSSVSGGTYIWWDHSQPQTVSIPLYRDVQPTLGVRPPRAYIIPQEWTEVLSILRLHGVQLHRTSRDANISCERSTFSKAVWRTRPYEGRVPVNVETRKDTATLRIPAGSFVVDLAQSSARVAINLLEADAPDSFVFWGFFNAVFEQKEYYEAYMMEAIAPEMLQRDEKLREEFEQRLASDTAFASSPRARLDFFYERSPWYDTGMNVYPVLRCMSLDGLPLLREEEWQAHASDAQ